MNMTGKTPPRGIRNNNPGNIRLSSSRWQGQKKFQFDPAFVEFEDPVFGLRALMRLLLTYYIRYRLDTVESIVNRYAPPAENATEGYIRAASHRLCVKRGEKIDVTARPVLITFARAITRHENGPPSKEMPADWYDDAVFERAASLALEN
jgi:hypothetical protein